MPTSHDELVKKAMQKPGVVTELEKLREENFGSPIPEPVDNQNQNPENHK